MHSPYRNNLVGVFPIDKCLKYRHNVQMINFKPLKGNVLIKQKIEDDTTASGIILSNEKKKHPMGEVVACNTDEPIKVGDVVLFEKLKYVDMELDGEDYILTKDGHILGIMDG